jgi:hypothetical protein
MRADMNGVGVRMVVGAAVIAVLALGCPGEKRAKRPTDLSKVETSLPPAAPDTFKGPAHKVARKAPPPIPSAPPALMEAVDRERSFSRFCYQEFGQKVDPTLKGGVAMVVSVGSAGITGAKVASDTWSSNAGSGVNRCLDQKAATAWKLAPGAVKSGKYVVRMTFTGR